MRLIDADALINRITNPYERAEVARWVNQMPTVDVLQKLWNAFYTEEDKLEKRYIRTSEHDNWFLVYRPWLQDGFGIAIKVLSEIFAPEPPKENVNGNMDF